MSFDKNMGESIGKISPQISTVNTFSKMLITLNNLLKMH